MQIELEYEISSNPRYYPQPHDRLFRLLNQNRSLYADRLRSFLAMAADYLDIPAEPTALEPYWLNPFFSPLDAIALTDMIQSYRPPLYLEIGSGNSTRFARRASRLYSPHTSIISIDPYPRAEVDTLCDEVIRKPLEAVADLSLFDRLQSGDVLFFDGSHRCFMNSDVTVFCLDILPRLKPGVVVHLHDIFLPWDYPEHFAMRFYSEQYLLACWLLAGNHLRVELPNWFITKDQELLSILDPIWPYVASEQREGCSFWLTIQEPAQ